MGSCDASITHTHTHTKHSFQEAKVGFVLDQSQEVTNFAKFSNEGLKNLTKLDEKIKSSGVFVVNWGIRAPIIVVLGIFGRACPSFQKTCLKTLCSFDLVLKCWKLS